MKEHGVITSLILVGLVGIVGFSPVRPARAAQALPGETLDLKSPCAKQVDITVDPAIKSGAMLDSGGASATISQQNGKNGATPQTSLLVEHCRAEGRLDIRLAPNTALILHDSPDAHFTIKGVLSSLEANLDSDTLELEHVQSLDLSVRGASHVHIGVLERAAQIVASGTSSLTIDSAQLSALSAQLTNQTSLTIAHASVDALTVIATDQASATIMGRAGAATVTAANAARINIEKVDSPLVRSGDGAVHVGAPNGEIVRTLPAAPTPPERAPTDAAGPGRSTAPPQEAPPAPSAPVSSGQGPAAAPPPAVPPAAAPAPSTAIPPAPEPEHEPAK